MDRLNLDALYEVIKWNVHASIEFDMLNEPMRTYLNIVRAPNVFCALFNEVIGRVDRENVAKECMRINNIFGHEFGIDAFQMEGVIISPQTFDKMIEVGPAAFDLCVIDFMIVRKYCMFMNITNLENSLRRCSNEAVLELLVNKYFEYFSMKKVDGRIIFEIEINYKNECCLYSNVYLNDNNGIECNIVIEIIDEHSFKGHLGFTIKCSTIIKWHYYSDEIFLSMMPYMSSICALSNIRDPANIDEVMLVVNYYKENEGYSKGGDWNDPYYVLGIMSVCDYEFSKTAISNLAIVYATYYDFVMV